MKTISAVLFLISFVVLSAQGQAIKLSPERRLLAESATKDRVAYTRSKSYNPYNTAVRGIRKTVWNRLKGKAYKEAVDEASKGLTQCPLDIELLMAQSNALRELKDSRANEIEARWMALADSILISGDGKSFNSAFTVICVDEEYAVLGLIGLESSGQALEGRPWKYV